MSSHPFASQAAGTVSQTSAESEVQGVNVKKYAKLERTTDLGPPPRLFLR